MVEKSRGHQSTAVTSPSWPRNAAGGSVGLSKRHTCTARSHDPLATCVPSGLNAVLT